MHPDDYPTKETVTAIKAGPNKTNSSYGNWVVYADAHFENFYRSWDYPDKGYYFFTKKRAADWMSEVRIALDNGRKPVVG